MALTISCHDTQKLGEAIHQLPGRSDYAYSKKIAYFPTLQDVTSRFLIKQQSELSPEIQARQKIPFFGIFPLA